ncbi:FAST kinase domain-containing protein 4-like isoform X2 [Portunus trituberculatus]|uniref:FAST kinase domain-containing protein 4-like isoform X2 n=1 Tax=Portunus trituberculatus TaxID=210409 RepID=UPI001E1CB421|nr:FAST kinase domain-containing protein 4-like isoform X2 [Portunus trituberculatus]
MLQVGRGLVVGCVRGVGGRLPLPSATLPSGVGVLVAGLRWTPHSWRTPESQESQAESLDVPHLLNKATVDGNLDSAYQGLHTLSQWVSTNKIDFQKDVKDEKQFGKLITLIDRGSIRSPPSSLLAALKSLTNMGVSSDSHVVQSIENQLLWNIRKVSFPILLSILLYHIKHQNSDMEKKVLREAVEAVQRRWVEVTKASEMEVLYLHQELFSAEFMGHVDDRTTELAAEMNYEELAKVFCALGSVRRRATPVIRSLAFHMARQGEPLPPKMLSNILFAAQALTFPDPVLLEKVAADLAPQIPQIDKPILIGGILFCAGQLRWRCPVLLEALAEWVEKNASACPSQTLAALMLTLATVSYIPNDIDSLFRVVLPRLSQESLSRTSVWLDVVWALVVLGKADAQHVASVLNPTFVAAVMASEAQHRPGVRLKLLNVDAAAGLLIPGYSGPRMETEELGAAAMPVRGREELRLSRHVLGTLHNLVPPPRFLLQNLPAPMGVHVDGELLTDRQGRPLPIQDHGGALTGKGPVSPPPEGAVRLGLLVWGFRDYTNGTQELVGSARLAVRLLEAQGCRALQVPYFEYSIKAKTLKNAKYLEAKIKEVVSTVS